MFKFKTEFIFNHDTSFTNEDIDPTSPRFDSSNFYGHQVSFNEEDFDLSNQVFQISNQSNLFQCPCK